MEALIIEEVQNMALGEEVKEFRRQRNRAMLAMPCRRASVP